jgi:hypothetical protein
VRFSAGEVQKQGKKALGGLLPCHFPLRFRFFFLIALLAVSLHGEASSKPPLNYFAK